MYLDVDRDVAVVMLQHTNLIVFLHTTRDLPLLFVEPKTSIRRFFFRVLQRKELEAVVLVSILLNAGCSGLITLKPSWQQQQIASHAEVVLSGVFSLELMIRLTAYHPRAFLQSYWNVLDCVLVLSTIAAVCLTATPSHLRPFEVPISPQLLRTARTFRAARLIRFSPAVMASLAEALPKMLTLILLCLIVLFGCASMGVSMLSNICLLGDETLSGDNALRCTLVNDEGKLLPHSNFRNILMSLLTLVRFSTGDGWVEIMHRSALVSHDFPREKDAVKLAARALARYQNSSRSADERRGWLKEARMHLAGCVREDEMRQLQQLGAIDCSAYSFGVEIKVPCQGTCGTNLSKFAIPAFSLISTFLLLNLSAAIMIESLKMAHRFSGHRALLTKNMTKKRLNVIWALWQQHAQARGKYSEERPEIGKVLLTIQRAVDLPDLYYSRQVQVYCSVALHSTYRVTTLHPPSVSPEWKESFSMPVKSLPTTIAIRLFDRDHSSDAEIFLGETRIHLNDRVLRQPQKRSNEGGMCTCEDWYALRGLRSGGEPATGRVKVSFTYWGAKETLAGRLRAAEADGIAVPETPVFASSPGILLHQHRKMLENVEETQKHHVKNDELESRDCEKDKIVLEGTVKTKAQIEKAWKICYFSLDAHGTVRYFDMEDDLNKSKSPMASFSCHGLQIVKTRYKDEKYQFTAVVSKFVSISQPTSDILMKHPDDQKCLEFAFETEGDHAAWLNAFTRMTNGGADNLQCLQGKSDCNKKELIEEPNADIQALRVSSADSETGEIFKRVSSSERLADRESKISALLELDGVECVGHAPEAGQKGEADQVAPKDAHLRDVSRSTSDSGKSSAAAGPCRTQRAPLSSSVSSESQSSLTLDSRGRKEDVQTGQVKVVQDSELMISKAAARVDILNAQLAEAGLLSRHMLKNLRTADRGSIIDATYVIQDSDFPVSQPPPLHRGSELSSSSSRPSSSTVETSLKMAPLSATVMVERANAFKGFVERSVMAAAPIRSDFPRSEKKVKSFPDGHMCSPAASGSKRPPTSAQIEVLRRRGVPDRYLPKSREEASALLKRFIHSRPTPVQTRGVSDAKKECSPLSLTAIKEAQDDGLIQRREKERTEKTTEIIQRSDTLTDTTNSEISITTSTRTPFFSGLSDLSKKAIQQYFRSERDKLASRSRERHDKNSLCLTSTTGPESSTTMPTRTPSYSGLSELSQKAIQQYFRSRGDPLAPQRRERQEEIISSETGLSDLCHRRRDDATGCSSTSMYSGFKTGLSELSAKAVEQYKSSLPLQSAGGETKKVQLRPLTLAAIRKSHNVNSSFRTPEK